MAGWIQGACEVNGIDVHYTRTGGNKPAVVLLHGLMLNGSCWTPLARVLEKDYDVIMPDSRGHGYSSSPDDGAIVTTDVADSLAASNPNLKIAQIKGASHSVPYDQPERFSAVVQDFLRAVVAPIMP